ncbi:MAG TPA: YlxR family protein, partial [Nitrospirota bacterium]|nr:YlxR family protein [Nitrospirota bacterium]
MPAAPQRSCIACRRKGEKGELIKLAAGPDGVVIDYGERLPGRGAYVCAEKACIEKGLNAGALSRAFKRQAAPPDKAEFYKELTDKIYRKIESLLGMARKSGLAAAG